MDVSTVSALVTGWFTRIRRVGSALVELHLELAEKEASREGKRFARGLMLFSFSILLLSAAILVLHAAAAAWLHQLGLSWPLAFAALAGGDLLLAAGALVGAERSLRGPWMRETRERVARTAASLTGNEER